MTSEALPSAGADRPSIWLIGLGNIGFRHLQGLAPLAHEIRLEASDLDPDAVARAQDQWELAPGARGEFATTLPAPGKGADIAILATSARGRDDLVVDLLDRGVRTLVLEKVVFDSSGAFDRVAARLSAGDGTAHVNCARRMWPLYRSLAARCAAARGPVRIRVHGSNLGLACNGVHFIDLLQFLSGEDDVGLTGHDLSTPWSAKRPGYYEVWGDAAFATPAGARLELSAGPDLPARNLVEIDIDGTTLTVEEALGEVHGESGLESFGRAPYQSELTRGLVEALLDTGRSELPTLATSRQAHLALFTALEAPFGAAGLIEDGRLPIT